MKNLFRLFLVGVISLLALPGCSAKQDQQQQAAVQEKTPPTVEPSPLDRGAILARVRMDAFQEKDDFYACDLVIDEVVRSGPQSKPMAGGTTLTAALPKSLATEDQLVAWTQDDGTIQVVIASRMVVDSMKGSMPEWEITEIGPSAGASLLQPMDGGTEEDFAEFRAQKSRKKIEKKRARWEYTFRMLRDPVTNRIPAHIRIRELDHARAVLEQTAGLRSTADASALTWQEVGPHNVGGRTRALAVDRNNSNTILAGSASGGLWKSTDGGATWALKTETNQSVTSVAQAGNSTTWYYTTGEFSNSARDQGATANYFGSGLYKSTDNGENWTRIQGAGNSTSFDSVFDLNSKVMVHPITGSVFIASNGSGILRSDDAGATFSLALGTLNAHLWADFDIAANGIIVATLSQQSVGVTGTPGVFGSNDNGVNWVTLTPASFPATHGRSVVAIAASNNDAAYVLTEVTSSDVRFHRLTLSTGASVDRSANLPNFGGQVGQPNTQGNGYNLMLSVKPDDENFVIFGWTNLHRSTDGVATSMNVANKHWIGGYATTNDISQYPNHHPDNHIVVFDPANPNRAWSGHDGGVSLAQDIRVEPAVWEDKNMGYNVTQFYRVSIHPDSEDPRVVGGTQDNGSPFFRAGTTTSQDATTGDGATCYLGRTLALLSAQEGALVHHDYNAQGDLTFNGTIQKPAGASALFVHPFAVDPADETKVYFPSAEHFFRWNGDGWDELTNVSSGAGTVISAVAVSNAGHRLYYAGSSQGAPKVFRLDNANTATDGEVDISIPGVTDGSYPHAIAIHPTNPDEAIVVFSNYNIVGLFHTTDAGANWTAIEGNLTGTQPDAPGPSLRDALIFVEGSQTKYLVATSTGVYSAATLNGASTTWFHEDPTGMQNVVVNDLELRVSDNVVLAGTHGRGMFAAQASLTPVKLVFHDLTAVDGRVEVTWTTIEDNMAGFRMWRSEGEAFSRISADLILPRGSDVPYRFVDEDVITGRTYTYRLEGIGRDGTSEFFDLSSVTVGGTPAFVLHQAAPNPLRSATTISFELGEAGHVNLTVYDVSGRKVRTLVDEMRGASRHDVRWDGNDDTGRRVPQGTYLYQAVSPSATRSGKVVVAN